MNEGQERPLPPKKEVCLALLEGPSVFIHLDPRKEAAGVPPWFKKQPQLVLQIGMNMPVPIPDLHVDDNAITCTLSFNRTPFRCVLPWGCIYALVGEDGRGMVWPSDVPPEVAAQMQQRAAPQEQPQPAKTPEQARPSSSSGAAKGTKKSRAPKEPKGGASKPRGAAASLRGRTSAGPAAAPVESIGSRSSSGAKPSPAQAAADVAEIPSTPARANKRQKRELPPYLRIIK